MKTRLLIIALLTLIPSIIYCQEETPNENYIHTVDLGVGTGNLYASYLGYNIGLNNGLGKYIGNFIDYNMYVYNGTIQNHELSFKLGPYFRFNKNSYLAFSSGFAVFIDGSGAKDRYVNGMKVYSDNYFMSIPVQVKLNVDVTKGICLGFKGTYNRLIEKNGPDMGSFFVYLAYAL